MQIDRLIQIIFLLLSHENITAKQLAAELGVSARTIYRDINILSAAGIPILSQKGYRGGLSLLEGFSLDKTYFTQAEQSNIVQALQILKSSNYPDAEKTLNKVAGLFSHNLQSEWLEIDFSYWGSPEKERNNITALERAVINKYVITFTYYNSELTVTEQTAEPLKLVFKSHAWYLIAYSRRRKEIRTYKMSRMRELVITSELFDRELPADFSLNPAYKEEYDIPVFKLHFSEEIAYKVYDEFQEKYIKKLDDGTLEVTFRYQLSDWTFLYLLSFGEYVEIIEPVEARNILKEKARKILALYQIPSTDLDTKHRIQRNRPDPVLHPKIPSGDPDAICRVILLPVHHQAFCFRMIFRLAFHRDHTPFPDDQEVHLSSALRFPVKQLISVGPKRACRIIFCVNAPESFTFPGKKALLRHAGPGG